MAKTTRKPASKPEPAPKYSLTISIDAHLARRFKSACAFWGRDCSAVAAEWISEGLVGFKVGDGSTRRPGSTAEPDGQPAVEGDGPDLRVAG